MANACETCKVAIPFGRFCEPCGESWMRPRRAAIAAIRRELPSLPPSIPRRLGFQLMTPDDVRSLSDEEILGLPYFGPGMLARFRAAVPAPGGIANWVGEGVPMVGGGA